MLCFNIIFILLTQSQPHFSHPILPSSHVTLVLSVSQDFGFALEDGVTQRMLQKQLHTSVGLSFFLFPSSVVFCSAEANSSGPCSTSPTTTEEHKHGPESRPSACRFRFVTKVGCAQVWEGGKTLAAVSVHQSAVHHEARSCCRMWSSEVTTSCDASSSR